MGTIFVVTCYSEDNRPIGAPRLYDDWEEMLEDMKVEGIVWGPYNEREDGTVFVRGTSGQDAPLKWEITEEFIDNRQLRDLKEKFGEEYPELF